MKRDEDYLFVVVFVSWFPICFRFQVTSANSDLWFWWWIRRLWVWIVPFSATVCPFVWLVSCASWLYSSGRLVRLCRVVRFLAVFAGLCDFRSLFWLFVCRYL